MLIFLFLSKTRMVSSTTWTTAVLRRTQVRLPTTGERASPTSWPTCAGRSSSYRVKLTIRIARYSPCRYMRLYHSHAYISILHSEFLNDNRIHLRNDSIERCNYRRLWSSYNTRLCCCYRRSWPSIRTRAAQRLPAIYRRRSTAGASPSRRPMRPRKRKRYCEFFTFFFFLKLVDFSRYRLRSPEGALCYC